MTHIDEVGFGGALGRALSARYHDELGSCLATVDRPLPEIAAENLALRQGADRVVLDTATALGEAIALYPEFRSS